MYLTTRHDALAWSISLVVTITVVVLATGRPASTGSSIERQPVHTPPPALGVVAEADDARSNNVLNRAGTEHTSAPIEPESVPETEEPDRAASVDAATEPQRTEENNSTPASAASLAMRPEDALTASSLKPTAVESAPKPLQEMSADDIRQALAAYEQWVHDGRITLRLDYSRLAPSQLDAITSLYYVHTPNLALQVDPRSAQPPVALQMVPPKALVGDLTTDRANWPAPLAQLAEYRFGPNHRARANFVIAAACELRIYRELAQAVGNRQPQPGSEFVLRLVPIGSRIDVQLVSNTP